MKFQVIWTNLHKKVIEAESLQEAKEKMIELDSTIDTYQECIHQEISEIC